MMSYDTDGDLITTFDEAFFFAKGRFQFFLKETLKTSLGISLIAHLFCISKILPELMPPVLAKKYDINLGIFNQPPWEIKENDYPCKNAKELSEQFHDLNVNVIQRTMPHNPKKLGKIQHQYIQLANRYITMLQNAEHKTNNIPKKIKI